MAVIAPAADTVATAAFEVRHIAAVVTSVVAPPDVVIARRGTVCPTVSACEGTPEICRFVAGGGAVGPLDPPPHCTDVSAAMTTPARRIRPDTAGIIARRPVQASRRSTGLGLAFSQLQPRRWFRPQYTFTIVYVYREMYTETMKNVQISIDEETLRNVDRAAEPLGLTRSEIIRQALRQWLQQRAVQLFEEKWIDAARERPDKPAEADVWLGAQSWGRK